MGLGLDIGSFLTGVQERSAEIDKDLADRFKTLSEKKDDTNLQTKFAKEVDNYNEDKELLKAIKSAYASGDWATGQQLLGGFDSLDAYWKAKDMNSDMYYKLPKLGEEPIFTKADYGVTNGTTAGRIVESFFNPEAEEKRKESETPTAATYTKYRRKTDEEGNIEYDRSDEEITETKLGLVELQKSYRHKSKPDEITTIIPDPDTKGHWLEITLHKNPNREETSLGIYSKAMIKATGNKEIGKGYSISNVKSFEQANQITRGSEIEFVRQGVIVDSNNNILKDQKQLLSLTNGESTDGRRFATVSVKAKRTGEEKDVIEMNGEILTGWIYMHEKVEPLDKVAKKDQLTVLVQNKHTDRTDNKTFGTDALGRTKYTLHLTEDGLTGDTAQTLGLNKDGSYTYAGYYVTNIEDDFDVDIGTIQDYVEQRWVLDGDIVKEGTKGAELLDVKFKAKFTGENSDSITYVDGSTDAGFKLIGRDIVEATVDKGTNKQQELLEDAEDIIKDSKIRAEGYYDPILTHMGYINSAGEPLEITPFIAKQIARRFKELNITLTGNIIDAYQAQFAPVTNLTKLAPEGWQNISADNVNDYTFKYLGSKYAAYYDDVEDKKAYRAYINSRASTFSNKHYIDAATSTHVIERLAMLALNQKEGMFSTYLEFAGPTDIVFTHPTEKYGDGTSLVFTLSDLILGAENYKQLPDQQNESWMKSLDAYFKEIGLDEVALSLK